LCKNLIYSLLTSRNSFLKYNLQRIHFWVVVTIFTGLGFQVGVWTVLLADLAHALKLSPALLGIALSCFSGAGIVLLVFGSYLADRLERRVIVLFGISGLGLFYVTLIFVSQYSILLLVLLFGGMASSCYDLAVNTFGGDYERRYAQKVMTLFHAGFSGGATLGAIGSAVALTTGIRFRTVYGVTGMLLLLLASAMVFLPLPTTRTQVTLPEETTKHPTPSSSVIALLVIPMVLLAITLVSLSFFTDGALEGYISIYLRNLLGSGTLLGGIGIAAFNATGLIGRLISAAALQRYGERRVITIAGVLSTIGLLIALSTTNASLAVSGLLLVGFGQSPMVSTAFSLAAQAEPNQSARTVALVTAFGYSVFLISPLLIGILASLFSLRIALLLTIVTSVGIVFVAQRLPGIRYINKRER